MAPAHFALATVHAVVTAPTSGVVGAGRRSEAADDPGNGAYDEGHVSVPARLVASAPIEYPADARAAQVETDFLTGRARILLQIPSVSACRRTASLSEKQSLRIPAASWV